LGERRGVGRLKPKIKNHQYKSEKMTPKCIIEEDNRSIFSAFGNFMEAGESREGKSLSLVGFIIGKWKLKYFICLGRE